MSNAMIKKNLSQGKMGEKCAKNLYESKGCKVQDKSWVYDAGYDLLLTRNNVQQKVEVKTQSKTVITGMLFFNIHDEYKHYENISANGRVIEQHDDKAWLWATKADFFCIWVGLGTCGPKNSQYTNTIEPSEVVAVYYFKAEVLKKFVRKCLVERFGEDKTKWKAALEIAGDNDPKRSDTWCIGNIHESGIEEKDARWSGLPYSHDNIVFKANPEWLVSELLKMDKYGAYVEKYAYREDMKYDVHDNMKGE